VIQSALTGTVPSQIDQLSKLVVLNFFGNRLSGTLVALDKLTKLTGLYVSGNADLGGAMPALPTSLQQLVVDNCSFTALPPNLSALTELTEVRLYKNWFAGAAPVLAASPSVCLLQFDVDTNCFDCPANGTTVGPCRCSPTNVTACATGTTSATTVSALSVTPTTVDFAITTLSVVTATTALVFAISTLTATSVALATSSPPSTTALSLSVGVIIGIVLLLVFVVGGLAGFVVVCRQRRRRQPPAALTSSASASAPVSSPTYSSLPDTSDVAELYGSGKLSVD
jgi:hypothetical protein